MVRRRSRRGFAAHRAVCRERGRASRHRTTEVILRCEDGGDRPGDRTSRLSWHGCRQRLEAHRSTERRKARSWYSPSMRGRRTAGSSTVAAGLRSSSPRLTAVFRALIRVAWIRRKRGGGQPPVSLVSTAKVAVHLFDVPGLQARSASATQGRRQVAADMGLVGAMGGGAQRLLAPQPLLQELPNGDAVCAASTAWLSGADAGLAVVRWT